MQSKPNYVDMMIYFLFVKGVVELGYNAYNAGLWNFNWINSQSVDHDTQTYNAGLWNLNWHQDDNDTDIDDDTNQVEVEVGGEVKVEAETEVETETITDIPPLCPVDGYNEDIIHTNKYDETIPDSKDSKYYSTEEVSRIALAVEGRRNGQTNYWLGNKNFIIDVSGDFVENKPDLSSFNLEDNCMELLKKSQTYNHESGGIEVFPRSGNLNSTCVAGRIVSNKKSYPWFNSSRNGIPVEMDLDNTLDTIKPFNTIKLDTVKLYENGLDDNQLDVVDITTHCYNLHRTIVLIFTTMKCFYILIIY